MNIFWLQQAERDVPVEDQWLTPGELHRLRGMRFPQRRRDWRLGRWTAKCAVASYLEWRSRHDIFTDIEVRTAPSGAPEVLIQGNARSRRYLSQSPGWGCDLRGCVNWCRSGLRSGKS